MRIKVGVMELEGRKLGGLEEGGGSKVGGREGMKEGVGMRKGGSDGGLRMEERGNEGWRDGGTKRGKEGRTEGTRAKPGNQLVNS